MRPELVAIPAALALLFPLQVWIDGPPEARLAGLRGAPPSIFETVPSPRIAPILALGHKEAMADLLEIRATTFFSRTLERFSKLDGEHLTRLYGTITALDGADPGPWLRWSQLTFTILYDVERAYTICEDGLAAVPVVHPQRWRLRYEQGAIRLLQTVTTTDDDLRKRWLGEAGEHFLATADLPGVSEEDRIGLRDIGARLVASGVTREMVLRMELEQWRQRAREASERPLRERNERRVSETLSALRALELQAAVSKAAGEGRAVDGLEDLGLDLTDPLGAGFRLQGGKVLAPGVEAARLERALDDALARWRAEHPGQAPALADLHAGPVPAFLRVELLPDDAQVHVIPE